MTKQQRIAFDKRLATAFDNHKQPIVDKIYNLLDGLNPEDDEDFYKLCAIYAAVAESVESDEVSTTPVHNIRLWFASLTWLIENLTTIGEYSQSDDAFRAFYKLEFLWWYKWLISGIVEQPDISLQEIERYNDAMARYFTQTFDLGTRSVYKCRVMQAIKMGNRRMLELNLFQWIEAPEHDFDDCWACQLDDIVRSYCFLGKYDKALTWAQEILDGSATCGEVPHHTNSLIAEAYIHTGQEDKAKNILKKGYPLIRKKLSSVRPMTQFINAYRTMSMEKEAIHIYQQNAPMMETCESPFEQMLFHIEASHLPVDKCAEHRTMATELATKFDERNGNTFYSSQL